TPEKIIEHIVNSFGASIILGMIANTHTVVVDKHREHSFSEPCKKLAELFSDAIDSPKTGHFIEMEELRPFQKEYCKDWPICMRKSGERTYQSTSVLEKLYLRAEERYFKSKDKPVINTFPQKLKAIKHASTNSVQDEGFKKWLDGDIYQE
ncbi:unnamed protein product, partial [Rotaria sordida]